MADLVWVVSAEDSEQPALGFTGDRAWKAGKPRQVSQAIADQLTTGDGSPFSITTDPNAPVAQPEPIPTAPLSNEALTPPDVQPTPAATLVAEAGPAPAQPVATVPQPVAAPTVEGSAQ